MIDKGSHWLPLLFYFSVIKYICFLYFDKYIAVPYILINGNST